MALKRKSSSQAAMYMGDKSSFLTHIFVLSYKSYFPTVFKFTLVSLDKTPEYLREL
jgi:hypothetical protein